MSNFVILSIDASLSSSGWCVCDEKFNLIKVGKIQTEKTTDKRYLYIYNEYKKLFKKYKPTIVKMEDGFCGVNLKAGLQLAEVRGLIKTLADKYNATLYTYPPQSIKKAIAGSGKATKEDVYNTLCKIYTDSKIYQSIGEFCSKSGKNKTEDI